jgi:hypothetical protein
MRNGILAAGRLPDWANLMRDLAKPESFSSMRRWLELDHGALHVLIGGFMGGFRSPADPIFYAHHAFIDRLWLQWQKNHDESSCGNCNNLDYHSGYKALDYTGKYDSVDNCIKYPASSPRICLNYTESGTTSRRLSPKSSDDKCKKLMDQIDAGECHSTELALIPRAKECTRDKTETWTDGLKWLKRTSKTQDQEETGKLMQYMEAYKQKEKLNPRRYVPATSSSERRACMVCDVVCHGKPINLAEETRKRAAISTAFRSFCGGMTFLILLLFV